LDPCLSIRIAGDRYEGFVVVDSLVGDTSAGGVRIYDDLELAEIGDLAREMSLKYALFRLPRGGAKAGLRLAPGLSGEERLHALRDFGRKLGPIVRNGIYNPGMDMNCGPDELRAIYAGAGIPLGPVTDTSWFTALGVFHALEACAAALGREQGRVTVAVEGFGSVARHLAARLPDRYRIVALSTVAGAVRHPTGFEPQRVMAERDAHGDDLVTQLDGESIDLSAVFAAPVDILIPAARTRSLTAELAGTVAARAVVPIANAPYGDGAVDVLHARGIVCLPGYVVNVGGVLASSLYDQGVPRPAIEKLFATRYRDVVAQLVHVAASRRLPVTVLAQELATRTIAARATFRPRSLPERIYERFLRHRLPRRWRGAQARRRCVRAFDDLRVSIDAAGRNA